MSIYVMHIFFTAGIRIALKRLPFVASQPSAGPTLAATALEIAAATVAGIALPVAIHWVVGKFDLDKWFGLQRMEAA